MDTTKKKHTSTGGTLTPKPDMGLYFVSRANILDYVSLMYIKEISVKNGTSCRPFFEF